MVIGRTSTFEARVLATIVAPFALIRLASLTLVPRHPPCLVCRTILSSRTLTALSYQSPPCNLDRGETRVRRLYIRPRDRLCANDKVSQS